MPSAARVEDGSSFQVGSKSSGSGEGEIRVGVELRAPPRQSLLRSQGRCTGRGSLAGPPPPVVAALARSLPTPSPGEPPRGGAPRLFAVSGNGPRVWLIANQCLVAFQVFLSRRNLVSGLVSHGGFQGTCRK